MAYDHVLPDDAGFIDESTPLRPKQPEADVVAAKLRLRRVRSALLLLAFLGGFAGNLSQVPGFYLIREAVCLDFRGGEQPIEVEWCNANEDVQARLARVISFLEISILIPTLLTTFAYGKAADRWGRRPALLLCMLGGILATLWIPFINFLIVGKGLKIDPRLFCVAGLLMFIGGGQAVASAVVQAIVTDVTDEKDRFKEFSLLSAATVIPLLVAPPFSAWLTERWKWLPYMLQLPLYTTQALIVRSLPETKKAKPLPDLLSEDAPVESTDREPSVSPRQPSWAASPFPSLYTPSTAIILVTLFLHELAIRFSTSLTIQYAITYLHWTLQQTSFLPSAEALVVIFLTAVVVPLTFYHFNNRSKGGHGYNDDDDGGKSKGEGGNPETANLIVLVVTSTAFLLGSLLRGLLVTTPTFILGGLLLTFGPGLSMAMKSIASARYIHPSLSAEFFSVAATLDVLAGILAAAVSPILFEQGLRKGGLWRGGVYDVGEALEVAVVGLLVLGRVGWRRGGKERKRWRER